MRLSKSFCYIEFQIIDFPYAMVDGQGIVVLVFPHATLGPRVKRVFNGMWRGLVLTYPAHPTLRRCIFGIVYSK